MAKALSGKRRPARKRAGKKKTTKKGKRASESTRASHDLVPGDTEREPGQQLTKRDREQTKIRVVELRAEGRAWNDICRVVGVWYSAIQYWRNHDANFDTALQVCDQLNQQALEAELFRRALDGVVEDVYDKQGNKIGERHKKSDMLLLAALKKLDPAWKRALSTTIHAADTEDPPKIVLTLFDSSGPAGELASGAPRALGPVVDADEPLYDGSPEPEDEDED